MKKDCVLITGSSKGLGKALAIVFARNNYEVILHGRNGSDLDSVAEKISRFKVGCCIVQGDLRETETLDKLCETAEEKEISVLVNNAGSALSALRKPIYELSDEQIDELIEVHLTSPIKLTRRIMPYFLRRGDGTIININSLSGLENQMLRAAYCGSKWGLRGFTDTLRLETEEHKIRVIGVYPSRIKTLQKFTYGWEPETVAEKIFENFKNTDINTLILDNRPKEYRNK